MTNQPAASIYKEEVDFIARALIAQHGSDAPLAATRHLNELIDLGSWYRRDTWAAVVHTIHGYLGTRDTSLWRN
jgi:hypothetical protein